MAFAELKAKQSVMWGNGPYERITNTLTDIHDLVVERVDPKPGEQALDAATGTGAVAILAAKRGADVVGQDLAPVLIDTARERAEEEDVRVQFEVGDAEAMTYGDASFDIVTSTCGVMFAPDHAADRRRARPGHEARWTDRPRLDSRGAELGQMFGMMRPFMPPPPEGAGSPFEWGKEIMSAIFWARRSSSSSRSTTRSCEPRTARSTGSCSRPRTARRRPQPKRSTTARREEFPPAVGRFLRARREGDEVVHHREYLLTLGTRR